MDDFLDDKEARFKRQQEILKRHATGVDGKFRWRNSNHKIYSHRPALKPIDKQKLMDDINIDINDLHDL